MAELLPFGGGEDDFLRRALLLSNTPEVMGLAESEPAFSPRFERRMAPLLADPFRRAKKALRPRWARVLNAAAMLALVVTVTLSALWASPTARAWVERVIREWTGVSADFTLRGTADGELGAWAPDYVPDGYTLTETIEFLGTRELRYENQAGDRLDFSYRLVQQGSALSIDNEHSDHEAITLNGQPADLFRSNTQGRPSFLLWTDSDQRVFFVLTSMCDPDELLRMAESVEPVDEK